MQNPKSAADVPLTTFGGLCAEVADTDLPEGASPLNHDVDFDIGAVYTRAGLTSVYSYEALEAGPNNAGDSGTIPVNGIDWGNIALAGYDAVQWPTGQSPLIWWNLFAFSLNPSSVTGIEVDIPGHYAGSAPPTVVVGLTLSTDGTIIGQTKSFEFTTIDSTVSLGGPTDSWSVPAFATDVNEPAFGIVLWGIAPAGSQSSLFVLPPTIKVFLAKGADNVNWVKTFEEDNGNTHTFVLDDQGVLWEEDVTNDPGVLAPLTTVIPPDTFANSETNFDEEWIAFSDLRKGTAIPRHGSNLDRISQVGPGVGPQVTGSTTVTENPNAWQISSISQVGQKCLFYDILWSAGPGQQAAGSTLTLYYEENVSDGGNGPSVPLANDLALNGAVSLTGLTGTFAGLNGTYMIAGMAFGLAPHAGLNRYYFTVQTPGTGPGPPGNNDGGGGKTIPGCFQPTMATMTLASGQNAQIQIGQQVTITGAGGYDGTWTILGALNAGQYTVTQTELSNGTATYTFIGGSGQSPPVVGEAVTVTGAFNGPINPTTGASIFDVVNAAITNVTGDSFQVAIPYVGTVNAAPENAQAVVSGTVYYFDPGLNFLGPNSGGPAGGIFGSVSGGTVSIAGNVAPGIRSAVTMFETRNGYITAPSPPTVFETTSNDNSLVVAQIAIGPPNVIKRIVAFTAANGGNFFYIPEPVVITGIGQELKYSSTVVNDNVTTSAVFSFTDAVLLASIAIDIDGNNLFNQIEVGSSGWVISYAGRNLYGFQNNKVQNFINTTFDGGLINFGQLNFPAGWTQTDPGGNETTYAHLVPSPIFGFAYYIQNQTGGPVHTLGGIQQSAYRDAYQVAILRQNTQYSIRIWLRAPSGITNQGGSLHVDVYSSIAARVYGALDFFLAQMTPDYQEFYGDLIVNYIPPFSQPGNLFDLPIDLALRLYAIDLPPGADVEIDRFEIYPTKQPELSTDVYASYVENPEAVDGITGDLGVSVQNNQPCLGAFTQYDLLYFLKSGSMFSVQDSPEEEPGEWKIREISDKVGTIGFNSFDYGEEWMLTANRLGVYVFSGHEPIKISQEIQPVWDLINWAYGYTIVLRNDLSARRFFIQVPLPTPNQWLPDAPINISPTTPNVMLMCSYKELQNSAMLEERGPIKISFSGRLIAWDMSRKWSIWQIPSPYSNFVERPDGTERYFIGNGRHNSKVYMLDPTALSDDGIPIFGRYTTYGFVQANQAQQYGPMMTAYRKLYKYSSYNVHGQGNLRLRALVNNITPPYPYTVPGGINLLQPGEMGNPYNGGENREVPFNLEGQRMFLEFSTNALTANFRLSEIILSMIKSPFAPVRGIN